MDEKDALRQDAADDPMSDRKSLILADWLPPKVAHRARKIEITAYSAEQHAILARLATDTRMRSVWRELTRRDRKTHAFFHPAKPRSDSNLTLPEEIHAQALDELLFFVFCAARDRKSTSTPSQAKAVRHATMVRAEILRECATLLRQKCVDQPRTPKLLTV
jgi:hypothetical protein